MNIIRSLLLLNALLYCRAASIAPQEHDIPDLKQPHAPTHYSSELKALLQTANNHPQSREAIIEITNKFLDILQFKDKSLEYLSKECYDLMFKVGPNTLYCCTVQAMAKKRFKGHLQEHPDRIAHMKEYAEAYLEAKPINGSFDHFDDEMTLSIGELLDSLEHEHPGPLTIAFR